MSPSCYTKIKGIAQDRVKARNIPSLVQTILGFHPKFLKTLWNDCRLLGNIYWYSLHIAISLLSQNPQT